MHVPMEVLRDAYIAGVQAKRKHAPDKLAGEKELIAPELLWQNDAEQRIGMQAAAEVIMKWAKGNKK